MSQWLAFAEQFLQKAVKMAVVDRWGLGRHYQTSILTMHEAVVPLQATFGISVSSHASYTLPKLCGEY